MRASLAIAFGSMQSAMARTISLLLVDRRNGTLAVARSCVELIEAWFAVCLCGIPDSTRAARTQRRTAQRNCGRRTAHRLRLRSSGPGRGQTVDARRPDTAATERASIAADSDDRCRRRDEPRYSRRSALADDVRSLSISSRSMSASPARSRLRRSARPQVRLDMPCLGDARSHARDARREDAPPTPPGSRRSRSA